MSLGVTVNTIVLSAITFPAAYAITITGFGFGLISMSVYPNLLSIEQANVLSSSLGFIVILVNLVPIRKYVRLRILWPLLATAVMGVPIGLYVLIRVNENILRISLGVVILVSLAVDLFVTKGRARRPSIWIAAIVGLVSGALGGAFSISGPPVTLYLSSVLADKRELKASLLFYFLIVVALRLPLYFASGIATAELMRTALVLMIPLAAGIVLGLISFNKLSSVAIRRVIYVLLTATAITLIVRSV